MNRPAPFLPVIVCLSLLPVLGGRSENSGNPGAADPKILVAEDFETDSSPRTWSGEGERVAGGFESGHALYFENPDPDRSQVRWTALPADRIAGGRVTLSAAVKAENVSLPPQHWNGIKAMLALETPDGATHSQLPMGSGTFDWREVRQVFRIPPEVTGARLVLGLEKVAGKVWIDQVRVRVGRPERGDRRAAEKFTGHDLPRLRGVMHGPVFRAEDIRVLAEEWKANHVRWQLNWTPMKKAEEWARDLDAYDRWLEEALRHTDQALDAFDRHGIRVLVDLHCAPGGRAEGGANRMFQEKRYRDKFLEVWDRIATRYRGRECVYAYDLINEPVEPRFDAAFSWPDLATEAIDRIRAIDPGKAVVYEPGPWGGCDGFDQIVPLDRDRVIYSFHMYQPHQFTHQGVRENPIGVTYPGIVGEVEWNRERLEQSMRPAIDFQEDFNVQIYVGEFSAARWAPGDSAARYLSDCIEIFEKYGWDWAYHAYREASVWNVEHGPDPRDGSPAKETTDREQLLRLWFAKNRIEVGE